jgi:elongation factor 1 alpha-like protein
MVSAQQVCWPPHSDATGAGYDASGRWIGGDEDGDAEQGWGEATLVRPDGTGLASSQGFGEEVIGWEIEGDASAEPSGRGKKGRKGRKGGRKDGGEADSGLLGALGGSSRVAFGVDSPVGTPVGALPLETSRAARAAVEATAPKTSSVATAVESRSHHVLSMSGSHAALARRRGRVRIKRVTTPLPVPPPLVAQAFLTMSSDRSAKKKKKVDSDSAASAVEDIMRRVAAPEAVSDELAIVVLGHVDSGKSTLVGHTLTLAGVVSRKEARANLDGAASAGKASFEHAWVMDRSEESRARGITIDVGVARFSCAARPSKLSETNLIAEWAGMSDAPTAAFNAAATAWAAHERLPCATRQFCILDAPGHRAFVGGAIGAAAAADVAVLLAPAAAGQFEVAYGAGGTAREHALAARALGITQFVVAVTKMDSCGWSEARFDEIRSAVTKLLCLELGLKGTSILFVPVSGFVGTNILHPIAEMGAANDTAKGKPSEESLLQAARWYNVGKMVCEGIKPASAGLPLLEGSSVMPGASGVEASRGLTFVETLRCLKPADPQDVCKPLRMCVSDVFRSEIPGSTGLVAVGRVASGWISFRKPVLVVPSVAGSPLPSVRSIRLANAPASEPDCNLAWAGQTVEVTLGGVPDDMLTVRQGSVLCWPSHPIPVVKEVKARIALPSTSFSRPTGTVAAAASSSASAPSSGEWDKGTGEMAPLLPLSIGSRLSWHSMTGERMCHVVGLLNTVRKDGSTLKHRPRTLRPGDTAIVRLRLETGLPLEAMKHHKRVGKFMLRQGHRVVAAGTVLRVYQ